MKVFGGVIGARDGGDGAAAAAWKRLVGGVRPVIT